MTRNYKKLPRVALAGRRNVGKSTLLNALYGRRRAITDQHAGLTRDILEVEVLRNGCHFLLSDTPGLDIEDPNHLEAAILDRAFDAIKKVDLLLFVFEAPALASFDFDFCRVLRKRLLETPVIYLVNKIDGKEKVADGMAEFYSLGLSPLLPISAKSRWNFSELFSEMKRILPRIQSLELENQNSVLEQTKSSPPVLRQDLAISLEDTNSDVSVLPTVAPAADSSGMQRREILIREAWESSGLSEDGKLTSKTFLNADWQAPANFASGIGASEQSLSLAHEESDYARKKDERIHKDSSVLSDSRKSETRIALVGRPNVGKSSLFNKIVQEEKVLVSDVPGTTRDTIDTVIRFQGKSLRIMDTAGLRRPGKYKGKDSVEFYSAARTRRAIRDARVVIHLIDSLSGITDYDKKIAAQIRSLRRPNLLAFNKWDAVKDKDEHTMEEYLNRFRFFFPQIRNFPYVFFSALTGLRVQRLLELALKLDEAMKIRISTPSLNQLLASWLKSGPTSSRRLRIYYVTQIETEPPAFVFFVNQKRFFRENLRLYIENKIRKEYSLWGIPIDILIREKKLKKS